MSEHQTRADALAQRYVALRILKSKVDSEYKEKLSRVTGVMDDIESEMMTFLSQTGQESAKTASGTFFKKTSTSVKVADWNTIFSFIVDHDLFHMLTQGVNKTAVEQYIEVHGEVPPGVDITRVVTIGVNKPSAR